MRAIICVLASITVLAATTSAFADEVPIGCQESAFTVRGYNSGVSMGRSLVQRAWGSVNDCDQLELFTDIVVANVQNYQLVGDSTYTICRHTGLVDGVFQELDAVWLQCDGQCCQEGRVIGELAAELYCQLSIILDGLAAPDDFVRRPVFLCGLTFETCCDTNFIGTSLSYEGLNLQGELVQCLPYTKDPYDDVWAGTRELQCMYVPPPPQ